MARTGRPTKFDAERAEQIFQALRVGNYFETACLFAGVTKQTGYNWLRRGARQREGPFRDFLDAVERASAEAEVRDVAAVLRAGATDWRALAWRLERRTPERWGYREHTKHEITAPEGAVVVYMPDNGRQTAPVTAGAA